MSIISIRNLRKEFRDVTPLINVNADIEEGETISIIGPSGTGKSTLLRCINRLETPTAGSIIVDGTDVCDPETDIAAVRLRMGMVFQAYNLFPHKMAVENIMMPQQSLLGVSAMDAYEEAMKQLDRVGLKSKARQYPDELSGGQRQRVAIARALAMHPKIILLDEPTSALDPTMVSEVISVIHDLSKTGLTMVIVTHDMRLARRVSDRVFYMDEGEVYEEGPPEQIFENPVREKTRNYIFRIRSWEYDVLNDAPDMYEMTGTLEHFCDRMMLDRKTAVRCQLAVEELTVSYLIPALRKTPGAAFRLTLNTGEEGLDRKLLVKYTGFSGTDPLPGAADSAAAPEEEDGVSAAILSKVMRRLPNQDENTAVYELL